MKHMYAKVLVAGVLLLSLVCGNATGQTRWSEAKAYAWYAEHRWLVGCNYIPSTAIDQLEMWQADTFDPVTIDRELGWAEGLGFTSVRVFLHNLLWQQDAPGFLRRMDQFLSIAHKHHIGVVFVLFDSCWDPDPALGQQRAPKPFVHNSGWVQSPGREFTANPARLDELKPYVQGVVGHFRDDPRIDFWDVYNEPDNMNNPSYIKLEPKNKVETAQLLLEKTFAWAREMKPSQPLSSAPWLGPWADPAKLSPMEKIQFGQSDIITFHNYDNLEKLKACVENLRRYDRPVICSEYMARPIGSTFNPNLRYMKEQHVGAYNWGFVSGKTQTIFPWDSWTKTYTSEPPVWFHDIFRADGTPYKTDEVRFIKSLTASR
jgi:hypothetical protein